MLAVSEFVGEGNVFVTCMAKLLIGFINRSKEDKNALSWLLTTHCCHEGTGSLA